MVCPGCFSSMMRVLELERREAALYEVLKAAQDDPENAQSIIKRALNRNYGEADALFHDELSEAHTILRDVAYDLQPRQGNTHASTPVYENGETFYACSMPGCKLCNLSTRAGEFLERRRL